ncbi:MAG: ASCH domain-containing protein [Deltaproteobacteria bacterium]|nr:ASCH domain-containing protein [Deltaproteobacteria bacterium]
MKALSIKQPWSWLIVHGYKDIENRHWPLPKGMKQRVYVHAGKTFDHQGLDWLVFSCRAYNQEIHDGIMQAFPDLRTSPLPGCIVGEVTITDCVTKSDSPWFTGPYGFVLADPIAYEKPIPYRGRLGFFEVPEGLKEEVLK